MNEIPGVSTVPTSGAPDVALLIQTDELLDRIGRRMPVARDLDDPVLASLAVLAADVDLAPVSLERTRRAAVQRGLWPPDVQRFGGGVVHRDAAGDSVPATQPITLPRLCPPDDAPVASPAALIAPQRTNPGAGGTRRAERSLAATRRPVTIRVVPGLVAAGAALVLSMTAAAALTRGESVNPAAALVHVVREMSDDAPPPAPGSSSGSAGEAGRVSGSNGSGSVSPSSSSVPSGSTSPGFAGLGPIGPLPVSPGQSTTDPENPGVVAPGGQAGGDDSGQHPTDAATATSAHSESPGAVVPVTAPTAGAKPPHLPPGQGKDSRPPHWPIPSRSPNGLGAHPPVPGGHPGPGNPEHHTTSPAASVATAPAESTPQPSSSAG
ncbi:MAG: hypothetical protein IPK24_10520 [Kineosporiaceae bacterium]|nr:hypothetical protein [Kineosporiaceae bacterium]MBK8075983.1 hypothetical protein [Kineosporiaceae bacterium]